MARPKQAPQRSTNRLTTRTDLVTAVNYNETQRIRKHDSGDGMMAQPALIEIQTRPDHISIELRDWGASFDPESVPLPDFESLPESGFGIYIIKTLMEIQYKAGRPNVLTLSKSLNGSATQHDTVDGDL